MYKNILLFIICFCFLSCKKEGSFEKRDSIIGKWQLIETCISPGNSCVLQKIKNGQIIEFQENGEYLLSNVAINSGFFECNGKWQKKINPNYSAYQILDIMPTCNKSLVEIFYIFNADNTLNINPQCIEECRYTYKPVN
jgi:hypothetical protein